MKLLSNPATDCGVPLCPHPCRICLVSGPWIAGAVHSYPVVDKDDGGHPSCSVSTQDSVLSHAFVGCPTLAAYHILDHPFVRHRGLGCDRRASYCPIHLDALCRLCDEKKNHPQQ